MKISRSAPFALPVLVLAAALPLGNAGQAASAAAAVRVARAAGGMVVSASPLATGIGRDVLARGGNAVDAAVATAFALAVVWPEAGNIGGGGFMMIFPGDGRPPVCVDYREMAPAAATKTMFSPQDGRYTHKIVGVPGTVRGLALAHERYGRLPWSQLVLPAVRLARQGFTVDSALAASLNRVLSATGTNHDPRYEELRRCYGRPDSGRWQPGDRLVLTDLGHTLGLIAEQGADAFYTGPIALQIAREMRRGGGLITRDDLAAYRAKIRAPVVGSFRGARLLGPPPPSSGGICLVEALNILENFDLHRWGRYSPATLHVLAETMRRVYCDRARYLGDPDFVPIPDYLTTKAHARRVAAQINLRAATPSEQLAPEINLAPESPETTHFSIVDADGMAVSNTYTLEASWGSRIVVRGAGFLLNNEMGDFNWFPGHTDREGHIGTAANLIAPHKRMLSSQTPVIVTRSGQMLLVTGSPGGRTIINTVLQIVLNVLQFDMDLPAAVAAPRVHHQWLPDQLEVEQSGWRQLEPAVKQLRRMGHRIVPRGMQGSAHSIWVDPRSGTAVGVADWRRGGSPAGLPAEP